MDKYLGLVQKISGWSLKEQEVETEELKFDETEPIINLPHDIGIQKKCGRS